MKTFLPLFILYCFFPVFLSAQGNALNFDGEFDRVIGRDNINGDVDFTAELWFSTTDNMTDRSIIGFGSNAFQIDVVVGNLSLTDWTNIQTYDLGALFVADGAWYHIAVTKDGDAMTLYLNGISIFNWTTGQVNPFMLPVDFGLGFGTGGVDRFQGDMDEVRIWNIARTNTQIVDEFNCELNGDEPGLVTYYNFNQGIPGGDNSAIDEVEDVTINNHDGSLLSFALDGPTSNWVASGAGIFGLCAPPCVADFTSSVGDCGEVTFTSSAPTGSLLFSWDFGDGENFSSPSNSTTHTYNSSGGFVVCLTISDLNCTDTQCQDVSVIFNDSPPTIDCPASLILDADFGTCISTFTPTLALPNHSPCAQNQQFSCIRSDGQPCGSPFSIGTTTTTLAVSDNFGSSSCTYQITIEDNEFPQYQDCPTTIPGNAVGDLCGAFVTITPPPATDNCGIVSNVCTRSDGLSIDALFPVGTTIVTCVATDESGNSAVCEFAVEVTDEQPPFFLECPASRLESTAPNQCAAIVDITPPTAIDNCLLGEVVCVRSDGEPFGAPYPLGTTIITCTAMDANGNSAECIFSITVEDDVPPQFIECPLAETGSITGDNCEAIVDLSLPQAVDNCSLVSNNCERSDGLSLDAPYPLGTTIITCTATDESGESSVCSFPVIVTDDQIPFVSCPPDQDIFTSPDNCMGAASEVMLPTGSDNCGPVTVSCLRSDGQSIEAPFFIGTTTVSCTVSDESGNTATCQFTVTVIDDDPPVMDCPDDIVRNTDPGECYYTGESLLPPPVFDNCDEVTAICTRDDGLPLGAPFPVGTTCINCTASDNAQNFTACTFCVTVIDEELPTIVCPPNTCVSIDGENGSVVTFPNPEVTDNCDATFTCDFNSGDFFPVGETVVTCTAEDDAGNMAACSFTVNVLADSCIVDSLNISTGIDPDTGNPLVDGLDPLWSLVRVPSFLDLSIPRPASVADGLGNGWTTLPGSTWISALPDFLVGVPNNCNDVTNNACTAQCEPYVFERCFCKCGADSVRFVFNTLHDDVEQIFLVNQSTGVTTQLYSDCVVSTTNFITPSSVDVTLFLEPGQYCIETHIYTIGISMGFNLDGYISGPGIQADQCCTTTGSIAGRKFHDENCDGEHNINEPYLEDWEIELLDAAGNLVGVTTTDPNGFYSFFDLLPGTYTVSETLQAGWLPSSPPGGQEVAIVEAASSTEVNFANCFGVDCIASFEADLISPCGDGFQFTPTPDDPAFTYAWDFGDGSPIDNSVSPYYVYSDAGCYDATLTVTDLSGCVATYTLEVCATQAVDVYFEPVTNCLDVSFTNVDTGGAPSINWDFGDGNTSTSPNPTHTYAAPGTYEICLTGGGFECFDTYCVEVTVEACDSCCVDFEAFCERVESGFQYETGSNGCRSIFLNPNALDSCDVYFIDWGDGDASGPATNGTILDHEYSSDGTYTVCMTVNEQNADGENCWEPKEYCEDIVIDCDCDGELITEINATGMSDCYALDLILPNLTPTIRSYQIEILTPGVTFIGGSILSSGGFSFSNTSTTIDVTHSSLDFPLGTNAGILEFCLTGVSPGTDVDFHIQWFSPNQLDIPVLYCEEDIQTPSNPCDPEPSIPTFTTSISGLPTPESTEDRTFAGIPTGSGDYVIVGHTTDPGSGITKSQLIKLDAAGNQISPSCVFERIDGTPVVESIRAVVEVPSTGGDLFFAGNTVNDILVQRVDVNCNQICSAYLGSSNANEQANDAILTDNGELIVVGFQGNIGASAVYIARINAGCGLVWSTILDLGESAVANAITPLNGLPGLPSVEHYAITGVRGDNAVMILINGSGIPVLNGVYDLNFGGDVVSSEGFDIVQGLGGNSIHIAGHVLRSPSGMPLVSNPFLMALTADSNGGIGLLSTYFYDVVDGAEETIRSFVLNTSGTIDLAGRADYQYSGVTTGQVVGTPFIMRTDPDGSVRWVKKYLPPGYNAGSFNDIVATPDGGALATGFVSVDDSTSPVSYFDHYAIKVGRDGNLKDCDCLEEFEGIHTEVAVDITTPEFLPFGSNDITLIDHQPVSVEMNQAFCDVPVNPCDSLTANVVANCLNAFFTASASGMVNYLWNFGDGNTSTQMSPTHTYAMPGTYTVTLTVTHPLTNCDASTVLMVTVQDCGTCDVTADFSFTQTGNKIYFTDLSTSPNTIISWYWDFDDGGNFSTSQNPCYIYPAAGIYNVCLTVQAQDSLGNICDDMICMPVDYVPCDLIPDFNFSKLNDQLQFTNLTTPVGGPITWNWTADGTGFSTMEEPVYTATPPGPVTICLEATLTLSSGQLCTEEVCKVVQLPEIMGDTTSCGGEEGLYMISAMPGYQYDWSITGEHTLTPVGSDKVLVNWGVSVDTLICDTLCVIAMNGTGDTCKVSKILKVAPLPAPEILYPEICVSDTFFVGNPVDCLGEFEPPSNCIKACENTKTVYSTTADPGCSYEWKVVGGTIIGSSNLDSVCVEWDSISPARIKLIKTNLHGCADSTELCVDLLPPPTADISGNDVCLGQATQFNMDFIDADEWIWFFGDGTSSTALNPMHTFTTPGLHQVCLAIKKTHHSKTFAQDLVEQIICTECVCVDTVKLDVFVDPLEGPDIECVATVCPGDTVCYNTNVMCPGPYIWTVTGESQVIDGGGTTYGGTSTDDFICVVWGDGPLGTIELEVQNCTPALCNKPTKVDIPILSDEFEIEGPIEVCNNESYVYDVIKYGGAIYDWEVIGGTIVSDNFNTVVINWSTFGTLPQTGQIIVTVDSYWLNPDGIPSGNCWGQDTLDVTILPNMSISGPDKVCLDDQATYTIAPTGINVDWQVVGGTPLTGTSNTNTIDIHWDQGPGVYTIQATAVDPTQVCEDVVYYVVEVIEVPPPTDVVGQEDVCPGDTFDYTATGLANGCEFKWTVIGGTVNYTSYNSANITWGPLPPYEVWVKNQLLADPFCDSDSINLVVNQIDVSNVTITGDVMPCVNNTHTYTALPMYDVDYQWSIMPETAGQIESGQGTNVVDITWSAVPRAGVDIILELCGQSITYTVDIINIGPYQIMEEADCTPIGVELTVDPPEPGATYEWHNPNGLFMTTTTNSITVTTPDCYSVFIILPNGCEGSANTCVTDFVDAEVKISSPMPKFICTNGNSSVTDYPIYATDHPNIQSGSYTWTCIFNNGPDIAGGATGMTFWHMHNAATGTYDYYVDALTLDNCPIRSNTITVEHRDSCYQPGSGGGNGPGGNAGIVCIPNPATTTITANPFTPYCNIVDFSTTLSAMGNSHSWTFGDLTGSNDKFPMHTYNEIGWYLVYVTVTVPNTDASSDSCLIDAITEVFVPVAADFSATKACAGDTTMFQDLSTVFTPSTITGWEWDFNGDNIIDATTQNPSYTFTTGGIKMVTLTVTSSDGCKAIQTKPVEVLPPPTPDFSAVTEACVGEGVDFTDLSNGTVITFWDWDFGELGYTSTDQHPFFVYETPGTKTVTLTVTDIYGCTATTSKTITVFAPQITMCDITPANPGPLCPSDLPFTLTAPNSPSGQYLWSTGETTPTISVTTPGDYSVTIYDANGCECESPPVEIKVSDPPPAVINGPEEICFGETTVLDATLPGGSYAYQWANSSGIITGATSGMLTVSQADTYSVTVTDQNTTCESSASHTLTINPLPPPPTIVASPSSPLCEGMPITLTVNPTQATSTYHWNTGQSGISITVQIEGIYTVVETDENGCTNQSSITINPAPEKCIVPSGCYEVCVNDTMCIPGIYDQYEWMRDGMPITSLNDTCIVFDQDGVYTVKMTNSFGCMTTSDDLIITVIDCDSMMVLCDSVMVDYVETADTSDYCCFDIILENQVPDFFTMVKITPLTGQDLTNINILNSSQWSTGAAGPAGVELLSNTGALCPGSFDRYIPTGTFTPVSFCLDNFGPIPQQVLVEWIGCDGTICPDTLDFECARCIDITNDTLVCDNGQLKFNFEFTNVWDLDICSLAVNYVLPTGAIVDPDPLIFGSCIPVGSGSGPQSLCIDNVGNASEIKLVLQAFEDECCWCLSDTLCLPVPVCCDTCESIEYFVSDTTINNDTCCFTLDVYHCVDDFFTGIKLEALGNVFFSEQLAPNDWYIQSPTNKMGTWHPKPTPPHSTFIPPGWNYDKIQFCLGGYDTPADVPQQVKFSWLGGSNDEVVCMDTLEFNCQPPPIEDCAALVDTTIQCLPNGDYQVDLKALILANFTVQQLWVRDLHSIPPGATFTPGAPVIVNGPFNPGNMVNIPPITVGNVSPGDSVCFYITLFDNLVGDDASNHCCHTDTICVVIPEDLCPPDSCVCTGWNDFTVSDFPVNSWAINGVMCGDHVVLPDCAYEFWLDGSFNCEGDSCMATHNWALTKQGGGIVDPLSNFNTGNQFFHGWDVTPNGDPSVSGPGIYVLQLNGHCSDSTAACGCMLTFEIPCDTMPVLCDTLDWSRLNYTFDWVYTDSCQTPDVEINIFPNGGIVPDWTEFDFGCDNSVEFTIPTGGYPVSGNFGAPGAYQVCIKAYQVVAGDTCFDERVLTIYVPECDDDCEVPCWDNFVWEDLAPSQFFFIIDVVAYNGDIIFGVRNNGPNNSVFRWDGSTITQMGDGLNDDVMALEVHGGRLYAGGSFTATIPGTPLNNIAVYNDALDMWEDVGNGVSDLVRALQSTPTGLAVGGHFQLAGPSSLVVDNVAMWDGTNWSALGTGTNGKVTGLGMYNGNLVVGGEFGNVGNNIAVWDFGTSSWTTISLGSGVDGVGSNFYDGVWSMEQLGPDLYIGGTFSNANNGGTSCTPAIVPGTQNIAKWNGTTGCWETLAGGVSGSFTAVYDLKVMGGNVIAAGTYNTIGGQSINSIARWDGTQWNDLGLPAQFLLHAVSCLPDSSGKCELYTGGEGPLRKLSMSCDTCELALMMPADTSICKNDMLVLNPVVTGNTGPYTCSWSPATNLSSTTSCNPVFSTNTPGTYTYMLTVTDSLGCDTTGMVTITVDDCDTCMLSLTMPSDTTICANDQLTLNPLVTGNTGPYTCTWTPSTNLSSATSCNPVFSTNTPGTYTYSLTVSDSLGCDTTATMTIIVDPCDTCMLSLTMPSDTTICTNDQLTLNPLVTGNTGPYTCTWTPSTNLSSATSCNPVFSTNTPGTYTYSLTVSDSLGCDTTATMTIIVDSCDTCMLSLTMPSDTSICANDQLTLNPLVTGNTGPYTCTWTPSTNLSSATSCNPVFSTNTPGTYTYSLTVSDSLGCDTTATMTIIVDPCDTCMLSLTMPSDTSICANDMLVLNPVVSGNTGPYTCSWSPGTNLSSATSCNPVFTASVPGSYTYTLTVSDSLGCDTSAMVTITVDPCDTCMLSLTMPSDTMICANEILMLNPLVTGNTGPYSCSWSPAANLSSTTSCNPIFAATTPGTYTYTLSVTDSLGCDTSAMVTIIVDDCPAPCQTCDSIQYVVTPITIQEDTCCFNLDIYHCSDSLFTGINLEALGNIFFSEQVAPPDWYITTQTSDQGTWHPKPTPPHGTYIPPGWNLSKIQFCLGGYDTFNDIPQEVALNWLGGSNSNVLCTDTLEFFCQPPAPEDCAEVVDTSITCLDNGDYLLELDLKVLANFTVEQIKVRDLHSLPPGATFNPSNPIISGPFEYCDTVSIVPITISNAQPGDTVCFYLTLFNNIVGQDASNHFCHTDTICIVLPDCCTTCGSIDYVITPTTVQEDTCCFVMDLYHCTDSLFTGINLEALGNIFFSEQIATPDWYITTQTSDQGTWHPKPTPPHGTFIPPGWNNGKITFCLGGYDTFNDIPQEIQVSWLGGSNDNVICTDTLEFFCQPPAPEDCAEIVDTSITCLADGTYLLDIDLEVLANFTVEQIKVRDLHSIPGGAIFNPSNPIISGPFDAGDIASMTPILVTNAQPGDLVCFYLTLFNNVVGQDASNHFCHTDTICIVLPPCEPISDCEYLDWSTIHYTCEYEYRDDCITPELTIDLMATGDFVPDWVDIDLDCDSIYDIEGGTLPFTYAFEGPGIYDICIRSCEVIDGDTCCDEKMKTIVILDCPIDTFECDLDYDHAYLGWSVMTHFSGFLVPSDPDLGINPAGPVLGIYDVRNTDAALPGQNWAPDVLRLPFGIASEMGQVFGVAVDEDGCIYAAATSIYLEPDVLHAHGTAGSGGIYKICPDGSGGWNRQDFDALSVQNLNTAAGLGNICYDPVHEQLFITNFEDGTIYRMDKNTGAILSSWTFPEPMTFETVDTTFEFVDLGRRIWGIGYHIKENRLYFSAWNEDRLRNDSLTNNEIWSIGLDATGEFDFVDGHELEITLSDLPDKDYSNPVADISFSANGALLLGERTMDGDIGFPGDSEFAHEARVLEYRGTHQTTWNLNTNFYVGNYDGVMPTHRNSSGGVDYGYDNIYDDFDDGCDSLVWSTGDALRYPGDNPDNSQEYVYGMAAMPRTGNTNVPGPDFVAVTSLYVDEDGDLDTPAEAGIGDMEIFRNPCCNPVPLPCELEVFINENVPSQTFCLGEDVNLNTFITGAIGDYQCLWFSTYPLPEPPDCDFSFVADETGEFLFVSTIVDENGCIAQDSIEIIVVDCIECCQDFDLFCDKVDESFTYAYTCDSLYVRANGLDHCHTVEWIWGSDNTSGQLSGDQMAVYPISGLTSTNLSVRVREYAGSDFCWDKIMGRSIAATCQDVESMLDDFPFDIDESNLPAITITPNPNLLILDKYDVDVDADGVFEYQDLGSVTVLTHTLTEEVNNVVIRLKRPNCDELCSVDFGHVIVVTDIPTYPDAALSVFPNPTNHLVRVVFQQQLNADAQLELYDLHGRRLQQEVIPAATTMTTLNLERLPAAVYMLKVRVGEQSFLRKVVKQ